MYSEPAPFLSIAMGVCYRRTEFETLERSIRSILDQTYSNFEFLICESGSTDGTRRLLEAFVKEDGRVRLIDGSGMNTLAQKLNRCIQAAAGVLLARQDDDDYSAPERLETQVSYLLHHRELSFVGCSVKLAQDGQEIGVRHLPERPVLRDFLFVQPYIHPTLLFHGSVLKAVGGYCEEPWCDGCEDYDLLLRLYEKGYTGANLQQLCFTYTLPPKGKSNRTFRMRCNETRTRFLRFRELGLLPRAFPYVLKPVLVGFIPTILLQKMKNNFKGDSFHDHE